MKQVKDLSVAYIVTFHQQHLDLTAIFIYLHLHLACCKIGPNRSCSVKGISEIISAMPAVMQTSTQGVAPLVTAEAASQHPLAQPNKYLWGFSV